MRGLVVSPPIEISSSGLLIKNARLDLQELRFSLLFWDKLDFPSNSNIDFGLGSYEAFLQSEGILQRTRVEAASGSAPHVYRSALITAFEVLNRQEPGVWSVATGEKSVSFLDEQLQAGRGILVRLHRALPVPDKDVPLQDLLEFRDKRRPELLALRHHLEAIYNRVINSADLELSLRSEFEALELGISDFIKSARGLGFSWRLADLSANLNVEAAIGAAITAQRANLSYIETLLSMTGASISVGVGAALIGKNPTSVPYRYVSAYHTDLFPLS